MVFALHWVIFAFRYLISDKKRRKIPVAEKFFVSSVVWLGKPQQLDNLKTFLVHSTILTTSGRASGHADTLFIATASFNRPIKSLACSSTYLKRKISHTFWNRKFSKSINKQSIHSLSNCFESIIWIHFERTTLLLSKNKSRETNREINGRMSITRTPETLLIIHSLTTHPIWDRLRIAMWKLLRYKTFNLSSLAKESGINSVSKTHIMKILMT